MEINYVSFASVNGSILAHLSYYRDVSPRTAICLVRNVPENQISQPFASQMKLQIIINKKKANCKPTHYRFYSSTDFFIYFTLIKNVVHIIKRGKIKSSSEMRCQLIITLCIIKTEKCWEKQHLQLPVQILRGVQGNLRLSSIFFFKQN